MVSTQEDLEEAARHWEEQQRTQCDEKKIAQTDTNKGCRQKTPRQQIAIDKHQEMYMTAASFSQESKETKGFCPKT